MLRTNENVSGEEVAATCNEMLMCDEEPEVVLERPPTPECNLSSLRCPTLPKKVDVEAATAVSNKQLQLLEKQELYMKELFHQNAQFNWKMEEFLSVKLEIEKEKLKRKNC